MGFSLKKTLKKLDPSKLLKGKVPNAPDLSPIQAQLEKGGAEIRSLAEALYGRQQPIINAAGEETRRLAARIRPEGKAITDEFGRQIDADQASAIAAQTALGDRLLQQAGTVPDEIAQRESAALRSRTLAAQPELQQSLREALAGTVGVRGGAAARAQQRQAVDVARNLGRGEYDIATQAIRDKTTAQQNAANRGFDANTALALANLGIDENTARAIMSSGREDLINELNTLTNEVNTRTDRNLANETERGGRLVSEAETRRGGLTDLTQQNINNQFAREAAKAANKNSFVRGLINTGATIAGGMFGGPAGAQVGSSLGSALTGGGAMQAPAFQWGNFGTMFGRKRPTGPIAGNSRLNLYDQPSDLSSVLARGY